MWVWIKKTENYHCFLPFIHLNENLIFIVFFLFFSFTDNDSKFITRFVKHETDKISEGMENLTAVIQKTSADMIAAVNQVKEAIDNLANHVVALESQEKWKQILVSSKAQ